LERRPDCGKPWTLRVAIRRSSPDVQALPSYRPQMPGAPTSSALDDGLTRVSISSRPITAAATQPPLPSQARQATTARQRQRRQRAAKARHMTQAHNGVIRASAIPIRLAGTLRAPSRRYTGDRRSPSPSGRMTADTRVIITQWPNEWAEMMTRVSRDPACCQSVAPAQGVTDRIPMGSWSTRTWPPLFAPLLKGR
jgi:hypothetical protein